MRKLVAGLIVFLLWGASYASAGEQSSYSFGVVPQQKIATLSRSWPPFLSHVSRLNGARLALPNSTAYAASILNLESLKEAGLDPARGDLFVSYLESHDGAYNAVLQGFADAAGGIQRTFDLLPPAVRARLRVLHRSRATVSHAFVAHRRVPRAEAERVARALTGMAVDEQGRTMLQSLQMKQIIPAKDSDWDELRRPVAR